MKIKNWLASMLLASSGLMNVYVFADEGAVVTKDSGGRIWNLQNADIKTVIEQVSRDTGKNFIVDNRVQGKITMISNTAVNSDEVYQMFLSMLEVLGYSAVENDGVVRVVPDSTARYMGLPIVDGKPTPYQDMVVRVLPIKNVSAQALVPVLRPLISPQGGHLTAYGPSNMLIVADHSQAVSRLMEIVKRIDVDDTNDMEIMVLQHAIPSEVVNTLNSIVNSRKPGDVLSSSVTLSADDRTNTLIMSGDKTRRLKLRTIIANLDIVAPGTGNTEVIYIKYQKVEDLVKVIINVIQSYFGANKANSTQANNSSSSALDSMSAAGTSNISTPHPATMAGNSSAAGSSSSDVGSGLQAQQRVSVGAVFGSFGVQTEPNLNALVVTAPQELMRIIKSIIAQLDVRRPQVLVEAIVVELEDTQGMNLGIDWRLGQFLGGYSTGDVINQALFNPPTVNPPSPGKDGSGTLTKLFNQGLSIGIIRHGSLRTLLTALETTTSSNILATPSVVALDNTKASIFVGNNVPLQQSSTTTNSGTPLNSYIREDVGLGLAIVPQITTDEAIVMDIEQSADTAPNINSISDSATLVTTKRSIKTKVVVNDGDVLVLGGLIRSQEDKNVNHIPLLGDLPIIGKLFGGSSTSIDKRNLMVFLRPTILRTDNDNLNITQSKYNFVRDRMILGDDSTGKQFKLSDQPIKLHAWSDDNLPHIPEPFGAS